MKQDQKDILIDFVLRRIPPKVFNRKLKEYSVQAIYSLYKRELMSEFPDLMPTDLRYSVAMSEAFEEYKLDTVRLQELEPRMNKKRSLAVSRSIPAASKQKYRREYNEMVEEWNRLLEPQQKLIKRYKNVRKHNELPV